MTYEPVIGLEVHVQLNTATKIFCRCSTKFGAGANTQTCPVCQGQPGVLPVLNEEVLKKGILAGLAINSTVAGYSKFDRKNYFYPDLPKAYQISQYDRPICEGGYIEINTPPGGKRIGITRLHLEEDAGKSIHSEDPKKNISYVDLNRTGVPLAEIVSEPDIRSADEAYEYLQNLKTIMKYIGVSDVNMEEGSLRCDVNISLREAGTEPFGEKVEIKNLNSFKAVKAAINYEIERQKKLLEEGEKSAIVQETRLWDADRMVTYSMRSKEDAHDYRYFPDPDLPPIIIAEDYIETLRKSLPELPAEKKRRFIDQYELSDVDAAILVSTRQLADYFEAVIKEGATAKRTSNWILSELLARIDDPESLDRYIVTPSHMARLLKLIDNDTISGKIAKNIFDEMIKTGDDPEKIVEEKGMKQVTDLSEIEPVIERIIRENPQSVEDYRNGKEKALGFLVGQAMKETKGKANPQIVNQLLREKMS
ncbi:MAG: Asp-tRNA(Asn)/Glu-tRNA(Gln) amidotransferase GatCAB subunit B [Spirochaetae bacterium HGW-Spirochaetae-1]|jgi:aspartyl-tRNA(Asn)/glutamyl-tRNA(Gln) amidotransferase subunit B|nr:MAG: Asp-tRNA(Asn)/Glu-tRNA(Gln) amidotransferase GatCAB subunit B [Spirochaetae bacterium HGW-Spirochaetae-1]